MISFITSFFESLLLGCFLSVDDVVYVCHLLFDAQFFEFVADSFRF